MSRKKTFCDYFIVFFVTVKRLRSKQQSAIVTLNNVGSYRFAYIDTWFFVIVFLNIRGSARRRVRFIPRKLSKFDFEKQ